MGIQQREVLLEEHYSPPFTGKNSRDTNPDMDEGSTQPSNSSLGTRDRIDILLEEYRSLNTLLLFRLEALDRRLPVSAGFLAATIASVLALPTRVQWVVLFVTPLAILWLVRTTIHHAQAKEDHRRRIDEIERHVNRIAAERLMVFQSHHPAGEAVTAGRTGRSTVDAATMSGLCMLLLCVVLFWKRGSTPDWIYVLCVALGLMIERFRLRKYRYTKPIRS